MKNEIFQNLHLQLSKDDIRRIDGWKVNNGMKSRAEAIRNMIKVASMESSSGHGKAVSAHERESYGYWRGEEILPSKNTKSEPSIEEMVRKLVKEELEKISKKKTNN